MSNYTTAQKMLVIRDSQGGIVAAQLDSPSKDGIVFGIAPTQPDHSLHWVADVPAEICNMDDPIKFQQAINEHVKSPKAKITATTVQELNLPFIQMLEKAPPKKS